MISRLKEKNRLNTLVLFTLTTLMCITLVALRYHFTYGNSFVYLVWNIFLAIIPYGISTVLILYHSKIKNRWMLIAPILVWLLFFPNAPYIVTDLVHLKQRPDVPYWFDQALILFFLWNGLMLGYASLMDIQRIITDRFTITAGWIVAITSLVLGSYGIYLGRYLRRNSWDIIASPTDLMVDITDHVTDPLGHPRTFGVTIIFSIFLVLGYLLLVQIASSFKTQK